MIDYAKKDRQELIHGKPKPSPVLPYVPAAKHDVAGFVRRMAIYKRRVRG